MIVVVGSGLVAVTAAQSFRSRAQRHVDHRSCGIWIPAWRMWIVGHICARLAPSTLEEAVAVQDRSRITCRSQWLVKRLVHLFTAAGGRTSTRVRLQQLEGEWYAAGTGTLPLADVRTSFSPTRTWLNHSGVGLPLLSHAQTCSWFGAVVAEGTTVDAEHMGQRADGSIEIWTKVATELENVKPFTLESMTMLWDEEDEPLNAARCAQRAIEAVHDLMVSGRLAEA